MPAEATHELGRKGTVAAIDLLWRVLGESIALPFNAYDHAEKLSFDGAPFGLGTFNFDLLGHLNKKASGTVTGQETVEVFVEVKNYTVGDSLLAEYESFLKRAAVAAALPQHKKTWFIFLSNVPFGTSKGVALCNGDYLSDCSKTWNDSLKPLAPALKERVVLVVATRSFTQLLSQWGAPRSV